MLCVNKHVDQFGAHIFLDLPPANYGINKFAIGADTLAHIPPAMVADVCVVAIFQ